MLTLVQKMEALAGVWHAGMVRKGEGNVPYIEHPRAVVSQLKAWGMTEETDGIFLAIAWGHDLAEDTQVPVAAILEAGGAFGFEVLSGILQLTFRKEVFPEANTSKEAKACYLARLAKEAPPEILLVKLADRICNTRDFLALTPGDKTKAAQYLQKAEALLAAVDRVPERFRDAVSETLEALQAQLAE